MKPYSSLLQDLRQVLPDLRTQIYFKASLVALSHALEDAAIAADGKPLVIACFQQERFHRQEARRYQRIAQCSDQVYVLAVPEVDTEPVPTPYTTVALHPDDSLAQEWHLVIIDQHYTACLICREHGSPVNTASLDQMRQFKGFWTFDRQVCIQAAQLLLERTLSYRPDLASRIGQAQQCYGLAEAATLPAPESWLLGVDRLFVDRLLTYLQANQFKLLKAYRAITTQERNERLLNSITAFIRRSLDPQEVLNSTVQKLGQIFPACRCILYRYDATGQSTVVEYESTAPGFASMQGNRWSLAEHPLFRPALVQDEAIAIADVDQDLGLRTNPDLQVELKQWQIRSCLLVPIRYQEIWLGMLELHHGGLYAHPWHPDEIALVVAIASQVGTALIQAQAYTKLEVLNQQLQDLERSQRNLIAIVGHELRTPLSTIQICLESLAGDLQIPPELQQSLVQSALTDSERLRILIQDFLTLSRLESGLVRWQSEPISLQECLNPALSKLRAYSAPKTLPQIIQTLPDRLPLLHADGEGITQVLTKLLDNARKFTGAGGTITIHAQVLKLKPVELLDAKPAQMLEVIIADTGRGIEPSQLESIFDRFYQEEEFLQRTVGGTGLGLAICRQIIQQLGGKIWATSAGKDQGSEFHFTVPVSEVRG